MKSNIVYLIALMVPALGLMSCSADKPDGPKDSWILSEPKITSTRVSSSEFKLRHATLRRLPGDAMLSFEAGEVAGATFSVESACQTPAGFFQSKEFLRDLSLIPLASLIPEELWLTQPIQKIESSQCAFRFFVTNPKGSTHRFDIENVQFDALSEKSVSEIPSIKSEKFKLASAELLETKSSTAHSLNLVCETFSNRRAYTKDSVEVLMFDELSNGLLANLKEGADPRMTRTIQNCQVVRQDLEPTSGIKTYTLSKEFQMRFPLIGADMQTEEGLRTVQNDSWNDQTIHRIELSNNNEHTIAYRIPARPGNSVQIQVARGVLSAGGWPYDSYYVTKSASFTPITTVSGASEMIQHGDDIYFRMDPHSTATIRISVSAIGFCISASNLETRSKIGGFFLGFENPFSLHQVRDWNGGSLVEQISREWIDVAPFKVGIISPGQKVLPMWQAFDGRLKYDAAGSKPSADQMVAAPHEEAMCSRN